MLQDHTELSKK